MWPFKKKVKKEINSKYKKEEFVRFMFHGEMTYGYIWEIKENEDGSILYDIQVGAQCPWVAENIPEEIVKPHKIHQYTTFDDDEN
ncbi:MAG: hypothetical protein II788_01160 [Acholeplasmatales bacterium]|jgi:hypothetical protein|nr:hypothetical protein [Acholeplasmatales bacterium]